MAVIIVVVGILIITTAAVSLLGTYLAKIVLEEFGR